MRFVDNKMTAGELLAQLEAEGGAIVCTSECSAIEIANARMRVGFVRRPKEWLDNIKGWLASVAAD